MWGQFRRQMAHDAQKPVFLPPARARACAELVNLGHPGHLATKFANIAPLSEKSEENSTKALDLYFNMRYSVLGMLPPSQRYVAIVAGYSTRGFRHRENATDFQ